MKTNRSLLLTAIFMSAASVFVSGCKYKVTAPVWDKPYTEPPSPAITSIVPSSGAAAGVNRITIHGHNLVVPSPDSLVPDTTLVTFNNVPVTLASADSTSIVLYRPNVVGQDTIKVIPHNAISEAIYGPYRIDPVIEKYGGFLQNLQLGGIAVDASDNVYVAETVKLLIDEGTSATDNHTIGGGSAKTNGTPWAAALGPDGNLYVMAGIQRGIDKVYLSTGKVVHKWVQLPKVVKAGDFGSGGYLFTGGIRTGLYVVSLSDSGYIAHPPTETSYAADTILAVKVFNGYVYVASHATNSAEAGATIWRNKINSDSTLGTREKVIDMNSTPYANDNVTGIAFSSAGAMYVSTSSSAPLLSVDEASGKVSPFYKGIIPSYCDGMVWSKTSDYLYMITGNGSADDPWTVYRVDMGTTGGAGF